jgi:hypothetical protein
MAVLTDPDRADLWADYMRDNTAPYGVLTKADLRAAVNALDDYFNANAAAINAAIPQPARGALSAAQKARLLQLVVARRYIKGV